MPISPISELHLDAKRVLGRSRDFVHSCIVLLVAVIVNAGVARSFLFVAFKRHRTCLHHSSSIRACAAELLPNSRCSHDCSLSMAAALLASMACVIWRPHLGCKLHEHFQAVLNFQMRPAVDPVSVTYTQPAIGSRCNTAC